MLQAAHDGESLATALQAAQHDILGAPVSIRLAVGVHTLAEALVLDHQTAASEIWLVGSNGSAVDAASIKLRQGAPRLHLWGLQLTGNVEVDGGELEMINTSLTGPAGRDHRALSTTYDGEAERPLLQMRNGNVELQMVTISGGLGGGIVVGDGRLTLLNCTLRGNRAVRGAGLRVDGGQAMIAGTIFVENDAARGGGAMHVSGGVVELMERSLLVRNEAPTGKSIELTANGSLAYTLPAPAGRWLLLGSSSCQALRSRWSSPVDPGSVDADYPYACSAGILGGTAPEHQAGPQCRSPCPAGFRCSTATTEPIPW